MRNTDATTVPGSPRARSWRWPAIIIGILACHVLLMLLVAAIAVRDQSFVVLPDYYKRALNWDNTKAAMAKAKSLGWQLRIDPDRQVDPLGRRNVSFTLTDAQGQPAPATELTVTVYHHAHAADVRNVTLQPESPGRFAATLPMRYAGLYQFEFTAKAGDDIYSDALSMSVEGGASK